MPIDTHLKAELEAMDEMYGGEEMFRILGPTSLSYTSTDSSREYMFTSHLKQVLTLLEPDVPRLQTGFENTVGRYNRAYHQLKGTWEVMDVIEKFPGYPGVYTIVLYNRKTSTYDMIEKKVAESLTEKFGYVYDTSRMDALKVGDRVTDTVLYQSTSYDKNMNYRYGKNARVYYSTSTDTLEDAIRVRRSWAEGVKSVEVDTVQVPINDNDVLLNLYGDDDHYQAFPDIGSRVHNSILCGTRRVNKAHILYDFQAKNMRTLYSTDTEYYVTKNSEIYDIDIYYNGTEPFPSNLFHQQLKGYYEQVCVYADKVYAWATKIKKSGAKYTENVSFMRSRYMHFNDPDYKWKNKDRAFGNIVVEFKVRSVVSLDAGSKLTGRYGDKGVIGEFAEDLPKPVVESLVEMAAREDASDEEKVKLAQSIQIVDDDRMPYTEYGPVDILLNMSGSVRRLNPAQVFEVEINFIAENIQRRVQELPTEQEKLELIFKFLNLVNKEEGEFFHRMYEGFDKVVDVGPTKIRLMNREAQKAFVHDIEENGFYLVRPPHKPILYGEIKHIYDEFPWIKPYPLYINLFGVKKRRIMKDAVVGYKYIVVLKQNSNKNFSARSTYRVNRSNLPTKDIAKKTNRSAYARTAVRLSEIYNLLASVTGRDIAEWNIFTRSSALGRKSLEKILAADGNPLEIRKLKVRDNYINTNADILNAKMKGIGLHIDFFTAANLDPDVYSNASTAMNINGYSIIAPRTKFAMYKAIFDEFDTQMRQCAVIESYPGQKQDVAWKAVFENEDIKKFDVSEADREIMKAATMTARVALEMVKSKPKMIADDLSSADGVPIRRRRGRKPKATKSADEEVENNE